MTAFSYTLPRTERMLASGPFAAAARSFIIILALAALLLLIVMLGYHVVVDMRARRREQLRRRVMEAVGQAAMAAAHGQSPKPAIDGSADLWGRRGIAVLTQVFDAMDENGKAALRDILLQSGAAKRIGEELKTTNEDYLVELIRMVGNLDLIGLDSRVAALLYSHRSNIDLQYEGFLTLSRLGSHEYIVKLCTDKDFVQTLSFRSLQQILKGFSGNSAELYESLLASPDHFVVRICLKRIGADGIGALGAKVATFLDSEDDNLLIDAIRTLGQLRYQPAALRIAAFMQHERWEVRSVAVTALAAIDLAGNEDALVQALQDSEWQVRYNAGLALRAAADPGAIRRKVQASGDRYAMDMLDYMEQSAQIWRQAQ